MTKEDIATGSHYEHSWEPRVAKLILEQLQKHRSNHISNHNKNKSQSENNDNNNDNNNHNDASDDDYDPASWSDDGTTTSGSQKVPPPFMVALVGVPGGGKSVSSFLLANFLEQEFGVPTMIMPHDGYHLPMEQLRQFPDAADKIYRRGAPDTFDPLSLQRDLDRIRNQKEEGLIMVPGFDHARGDPEPDARAFDRYQHQVVIAEGLYLLHDADGWQDISSYFDLKIFIESNVENCLERLKIRNLAIPGYTAEEIIVRVDEVDRKNAETVLATKERADVVVESIVAKPTVEEDEDLQSQHQQSVHSGGLGMGRHSRVPSMEALNLIVTTNFNAEEEPHGISDYEVVEGMMMEDPLPPMGPLIGTWEKDMAQQIVEQMKQDPTRRPFMVGLVGMPGSGKSASVFLLANELEQIGLMSMTMPHDGYHYTLDYLKSFANSDDAIYRRGAPDTFDPASLYRDMERIRNNTNEEEDLIKVPGFDHANGDPEPDQHIFDRNHHDVVICEGLYLLHDQDGWENIKSLLDFSIFMESDVDICVERVKIRNQCIPGYSREEIVERAEKVDRINAMTVLHSKYRADVVVESTATKKQTQ